ncbi:hypothetical protein FRB94_002980 [Tulasnella sp. JGI-2019a]|nr:hypothetical protein FRB94_002980 [Tulasnella sp. JGI-2019a]
MSKSTFLALPEDVMIDAIIYLDIFQIATLRQVCHKIYSFTHIRELWVRVVGLHIIANRLPWPSHALPLSSVPTRTIKLLAIRCLLMQKYWDSCKARGEAVPSMMFRYPRGSITWLHIIRSRWFVMGTEARSLELIDLENDYDDPVARCVGIKGYVSSGLTITVNSQIVLVVNTSAHETYCFSMDIPHLGVPPKQDPAVGNFERIDSFFGYTTILSSFEDNLAYACSTEESYPVIMNRKANASVYLHRGLNVKRAQYTVQIQLRPDIAIVAKDWNIEIYSMPEVSAALTQSSLQRSIESITPLQSLSYPEDNMMWKVALLRPPVVEASSSGTLEIDAPIILGAWVDHGFAHWILCPSRVNQGSKIKTYEFTNNEGPVYFGENFQIQMSWGEYGSRLAFVGGGFPGPMLAGGIVFPGMTTREPHDSSLEEVSNWDLPYDPLVDFSWHCAFDDAAGLIVVAMTSGRVSVVDALSIWKHSLDDPGDEEFTAGNLEVELVEADAIF